jgi:23S rRNA (adenine2030-N6)-methyltransferase
VFSYRHGFHAGNHADVLKHCVLLAILDYYCEKEAAFWYIDTHAGAGLYDLQGQWANKRGEYEHGIARVWNQAEAPERIARYLQIIQTLNADDQLRLYPGSPWLALQALRTQDRLRCFEWLSAEAQVLAENLAQQRRLPARHVKVEVGDGFELLKSVMPPTSRRAVTLIDPAYENKQDYRSVVTAVKDALNRFATGCFVVWYPRVNRIQSQQMVRQLEHLSQIEWLSVELTVSKPPVDTHGLFGSGLWIANPPYKLAGEMRKVMPWLSKTLALDTHANWSVRTSQTPPRVASNPRASQHFKAPKR